jgi:O-antigen ligase
MLRSRNAWLIVFFLAALLAPPLAVDLGDSGPHVAVALAGLGVIIGLLRLGEWRFERGLLPGALVLWLAVLTASTALAALYSGEAIAIRSLARVGLVGISAYVFFYVSAGPGRAGALSPRLLYWVAFASALFACVDFYYHLPPPAGHGAQFVWLQSGVFRRAQGVFYEASTLGNFCAFFLVMTAAALVHRVGNRLVLLVGGAVFAAALIFSYSRASLITLAIALAVLLWLERSRLSVRSLLALLAGVFTAGAVIVYKLFPLFGVAYWNRIAFTATHLFSSPERVLSGRVESWQTLLHFLVENPWHALLGVGYKTLPYSFFTGRPVVADNMYLSILVETGVVGLGALLLLNAAILREAYRAARSSGPEKSFYGLWIFCFWVGETVQMLSGDLLTYWRVLPVYFWVLAMAVRNENPVPRTIQ